MFLPPPWRKSMHSDLVISQGATLCTPCAERGDKSGHGGVNLPPLPSHLPLFPPCFCLCFSLSQSLSRHLWVLRQHASLEFVGISQPFPVLWWKTLICDGAKLLMADGGVRAESHLRSPALVIPCSAPLAPLPYICQTQLWGSGIIIPPESQTPPCRHNWGFIRDPQECPCVCACVCARECVTFIWRYLHASLCVFACCVCAQVCSEAWIDAPRVLCPWLAARVLLWCRACACLWVLSVLIFWWVRH